MDKTARQALIFLAVLVTLVVLAVIANAVYTETQQDSHMADCLQYAPGEQPPGC